MKLDSTYLKQTCKLVRFDHPNKYAELADDMIRFMNQNQGIGLAANQVGLDIRLFVMSVDGKQYKCFNPMIMNSSGESTQPEGCLSFPGETVSVTRSENILATWFNEEGKLVIENLSGLTARCFQHELDHLNGITIMEKANGIEK